MPFSCIYQLNNGAIDSADQVIFKSYIDESFGAYHQEPVRIAEVIVNGLPGFICSASPGFPSTKGKLVSGDIVTAETKIAYFAADGESVPCGRPYAVIRYEQVCLVYFQIVSLSKSP